MYHSDESWSLPNSKIIVIMMGWKRSSQDFGGNFDSSQLDDRGNIAGRCWKENTSEDLKLICMARVGVQWRTLVLKVWSLQAVTREPASQSDFKMTH
jgi:hypothetical protein